MLDVRLSNPAASLFPPRMRKWWLYGMLLAAVAVAACGLSRLRFDTDILSMLPGDLPEVKGLKAQHRAFAREDEAILLVESNHGGSPSEAAQSLSKALEASGAVKKARWQPRWQEDPQGLAQLLAYLWLNGDPAEAKALAERLSAQNSQAQIEEVLESIATSIEGQDLAMQAHDPFGFLSHPAVAQVLASSGEGSAAFASADGTAHLIFVDAPQEVHGYRQAGEWVKKIRAESAVWETGEGQGFTVRMTGEPVFSSEIGMAMEEDLSGSIGLTLTLIGLLFWWMQRRLMLLGGLIVTLCLVFAVALGVAGWIYGELSIMALSSAEILIGLATDYGLVICQEAKVAGHNRKELLHASGKPVLCGAATTGVVFLALNLGGLPGMAQLGSIVAYGLVAAGVLMIVFYLPWVAKFGVNRAPADDEAKWLPRRRKSWIFTGALVATAVVVLMALGLPGLIYDSNIMRPRNSVAMQSFERMREKFPDRDSRLLRVIIEAERDEEMLARIHEAESRLEKGKAEGILLEGAIPLGWWPDPDWQRENAGALQALSKDGPRLLAEADEAGFTEEGTALGRQVFELLGKAVGQAGSFYPDSPAAREIMRLFIQRDEKGGGLVLGSVIPADEVGPDTEGYPRLRALNGDGIWLSGWSLFKPAISGLVKDDTAKMLLPMGVLLVGMMAFIFRRFRDVAFALLAMVVSTVVMLAVMRVLGLKWNFINLMATPLLLGTGIDYAIHVTLSLKRTGMCFKELWNGTGKALLFCGASNVIGFGSLCFSSSDALVSLGQVAVIGILLSMAVSIFLLPGWHARAAKGDLGEG
ncbi:MMPL family transporter [Luteolibacter sp. GHJ8]|uniref:MMPL family transporter n=1 Tax=Luteolibacter rhizosphaerae TaxID=2989719 RepID=A0ABT3FY31_9BACT|nr:MMPL family transporter [Luteolibacter rhizosphaerae]MCW1912488.1 MMPL family transporter [Luteolibacter rhizosphaerae]